MLKQRIITALILAPIAIACIFFLPPLGFAIFVGFVITVGAWEWANLAGYEANNRYLYAAGIALLLAASHLVPTLYLLVLGSLWWCLALFLVLQYPKRAELWASQLSISVIGVLALVPAYASLLSLKESAYSSFLILMLFFLIWGADVGAYFAGKTFGQRKLAPAVSPGKSWEGFFGGLVTAVGIAMIMLWWIDKLDLSSPGGIFFLFACAIVIMISVLGDLTESMFKRQRGVKDSSQLLPGHGGVLDRIDSLLSAGPVFALLILLFEFS